MMILFLFWNNSFLSSDSSSQQGSVAESSGKPQTPSSPLNTEDNNALRKFNPKEPVYAEPPVTPLPLTESNNTLNNTTPSPSSSNKSTGETTNTAEGTNESNQAEMQSAQPSQLVKESSPADICFAASNRIKQFYQNLDNASYVQSFKLPTTTEVYFSHLIGRLLENPPVVSGETNDLFTILQNTAHFFRIIGKDNIIMLKGILDMEKDTFEYVLADYYALLHIPGCLEQNFSLSAPFTSLYDYAGFFLNTMGGRLYLFRRDSLSRMVVSYYAILLIDHANKNGSNSHGIDIRPSLDLLINEIESTSNTLQLKDEYLDNLYLLKEKYQ